MCLIVRRLKLGIVPISEQEKSFFNLYNITQSTNSNNIIASVAINHKFLEEIISTEKQTFVLIFT